MWKDYTLSGWTSCWLLYVAGLPHGYSMWYDYTTWLLYVVGLLRALCDHGPGLLHPLLDSLGGGGGGLGDLHVGLPVCHLGEQKKTCSVLQSLGLSLPLQTTHILRNSSKAFTLKHFEDCAVFIRLVKKQIKDFLV